MKKYFSLETLEIEISPKNIFTEFVVNIKIIVSSIKFTSDTVHDDLVSFLNKAVPSLND